MNEWSITGNAVRGRIEACLVSCFIFFLQRMLCLRYSVYGWIVVYIVNHSLFLIPVVVAIPVFMVFCS